MLRVINEIYCKAARRTIEIRILGTIQGPETEISSSKLKNCQIEKGMCPSSLFQYSILWLFCLLLYIKTTTRGQSWYREI